MTRITRQGAIAIAIASTAGLLAATAASGCGDSSAGTTFPDGGGSSGNLGDGGGNNGDGSGPTLGGDSGGTLADGRACDNLECFQVQCSGGGSTALSGTVYDPAGKVPVYNAIVYVPNRPLQDVKPGASCDTCSGTAFDPLVSALTDAKGQFTLSNVPVMDNMPLVVQIGKWRREFKLPKPTACQTTTIGDNSLSLPKNQTQGSMPRIALSTGGADPLECLLRKIGIDDSEFDVQGGPGTVHLYAGGGYTSNSVTYNASAKFAPALHGGAAFVPSTTLWSGASTLAPYDLVLLACEGAANPSTKPQAARAALVQYEQTGGRVFASHWHDYWFNQDAPTNAVATWSDVTPPPPDPSDGALDTSFPKGVAFKDWLGNTNSLTAAGQITIHQPKDNVTAITANGGAQQWITMPNSNASGATAIEYMTFNMPLGVPDAQQCGRVVYSDLHVSAATNAQGGDQTGQPFPSGCVTTDLSPQEKALEFMLFDLSSCVQSDSTAPQPPR